MPRIIDVAAGILWRDGLYLAVDRPKGEWAGWWEFPGGKVEEGEAPEAALIRELREELGVQVGDFEFWCEKVHHYPRISVRLLFYHVTAFEGDPRGLEGQSFAWVHPARPEGIRFLPADDDIVAALAEGAGPTGK